MTGKYLQVLSVGIQNTLTYRFNFLCRSVLGLVPLTATIFLWRAIFAGKEGDIAGYALPQMISYYLVITVIDAFTAVNEDDWQIAADIRDGRISQFLLKPVDYTLYRLVLYVSGRLVYLLVGLIPIGAFLLWHAEFLNLPDDPRTWIWFALSVTMTAMLQFLISFSLALLAFWILEIDTFIFIVFAVEYIAGGHVFPLDILPPAIADLLAWSPFPYLLYFPAGIFLERIEGSDLATGLIVQAFWVAAALGISRLVWSRGIRKYSAAGG